MNIPLLRFLEKGFSEDREALPAYFFSNYVERKNASKLIPIKNNSVNNSNGNSEQIIIDPYTGNEEATLLISELLKSISHPSIFSAIVHGSIATDEIIPYSDFDGLLIIDSSKITSESSLLSLRKTIVRSEKLMRTRDALQHHGWMFLLKEDISNYPDDKLPLEMIKHGKVIYPETSINLDVLVDQTKMDYSKSFYHLVSSITKKIATEFHSRDYYTFKNLLSEILLLPAVYLQAINKKPIFKRDSFTEIEKHFTKEQLQCINDASSLRNRWDQSFVKIRDEEDANRYKYPKFIQQQFRTPVPKNLITYFNDKQCEQIKLLLNLMTQTIKQNHQ